MKKFKMTHYLISGNPCAWSTEHESRTILLRRAQQPKLESMLPASFQIRDLTIRPATVLAPMAGVTDTLFRRVIRGLGGCGLLMTEFTTSEGITRNAKETLPHLHFQEPQHPTTPHPFPTNPELLPREHRTCALTPRTGRRDTQAPRTSDRGAAQPPGDAVGIGGAAATIPWIFAEMQQYAAIGGCHVPTHADRHQLLSGYYREI